MSATLNAGSFPSDDTLYAASRTLKSYLRSILIRKWDPTDPKVRFGSLAPGHQAARVLAVSALPQKRTNSRRVSKSRFVLNKRLSPHLRLVGRTGISFSKRPTWRMRQ